MFPFVSQVNNFFFVSRKFFAATVSRFLKARGAFMLLAAFEVNNFFPFRETLFHREASRFLQSRGAFMLPFASRVNRFFRFCEISFRLRFRKPFSFVAKRKFALNHANCQAASATIFKTIAPFTRKSA